MPVNEEKFKIGDLVKITKPTNFISSNSEVILGDVGLIVHIFPDGTDQLSLWGTDYTVLVRGKRLLFFADELELITNQNKLVGEVKFVYLKRKLEEI
tara:strand:+ start:639 stop:929 length:291 start_codon:yes stop_codon:yes gene_type:complete